MNKKLLFLLASKSILLQYMTDSAGVWYFDFYNAWPGIDISETTWTQTRIENIISVAYAGGDLTHVTTYTNTIDGRATALSSEPSFIFDGVNNRLYFRLNEYDDPRIYDIRIGIAAHISDQSYDDTVNNLLYREDLKSYPNLGEKKDPLFFGKIAFDEWTQKLNDAGRKYDGLIDNKIFGQDGKYYWGDEGAVFADYVQIKQGKVNSYQYTGQNMDIKLIDGRTKLSKSIPTNTLDQITYPDLKDDYIGAVKPLVYGNVNDMLCIPLDDNDTQTNYTFLIADTEFHNIQSTGYKIVMDGTDKTANVLNFSASAATFQLPAAHYTVGKDVTFTGQGYVTAGLEPIDNPLDIIEDILENYLEVIYTSTSFNTTEWDATKLLIGDIAIAIQERMAVIDIIELICTGTGIGFLLERNGKYTARKYNKNNDPVLTVYENQWKSEPIVTGKSEEVLTTATAKYNQFLNAERWQRVTDDSQKMQIKSKFDIEEDAEFNTLFTTDSDALSFCEDIMDRSNDIGLTINTVLKDEYVDLSVVKIGLIAQIEVNRQDNKNQWSEWLGKMKCEILSVQPNLENREVEIEFRKIESLDSFKLSKYRITSDGNYRTTSDGNFRITGVSYE